MTPIARPLSNAAAAIAMVCALAAPPAVARTGDSQAQRHFERAEAALAEGDRRAASIELRNALQRDPDYFEARSLFGRLLLNEGDVAGAERELSRAAAAGRSDALDAALGEALGRLGRFEAALEALDHPSETPEAEARKALVRANVFMGLSQYEDAAAAFEAVQSHAHDNEALLGLARIAAITGDAARAEELAAKLTEIDPDYAPAWSLRGELALGRDAPAAAVAHLNEALSRAPGDVSLLVSRARAHLAGGNVLAARADADAVIAIAPDAPVGRYLVAAIAFAQGDMEAANVEYSSVRQTLENFPPALLLGALIKFNRGETAQADQLLSRYAALKPEDPTPLRALGELRLRMGQPRRAVTSLEAALDLAPDSAATLRLLAEAQTAVENYSAAAETYRRLSEVGEPVVARRAVGALALIEGDGPEAAMLFGDEAQIGGRKAARALTLLSSGRYDDAAEAAAELIETAPENPIFHNLAASAEIGRGDQRAARVALTKALSLDPAFLPALNQLDRLDAEAGRSEEIEPRLEALRRRAPDSETLLVRHARLMIALGRRDEAVRLLQESAEQMPDSIAVAEALIRARLLMGDLRGAGRAAARLAEVEDLSIDAAFFAVATLADARMFEQAEAAARRLTDLAPESAQAQVLLAEVLTAADLSEEAARVLNTARERHPKDRAIARARVDLAVQARNRAAALAAAEAIRPYDAPGAERLKGGALIGLGDLDAAVDALEAALNRHERTELAIDLFAARLRAGRQAEAVADMEAWTAAHPRDRQALTALGSALMGMRDYAAAERAYARLLAVDPNNPIALNNYAWARHAQGAADALDYAARAHRVAGGSPEIADTYGWLLVQGGRMSEGLEILRAAAASAPDNGEILYHLAYALAQTGRRRDAAVILERALREGGAFDAREEAEAMLAQLR